jgi:predicted nucleotidyltransferase
MARTPPNPFPFPPQRIYHGADIPMRIIRRYTRAIAERFHPDRIILFGSYAYGTPHEDSDVDLLVVMPCYRQGSMAYKIRLALSAPFPMDLIVRTPQEISRRLADGDLFHTEIVPRGKVLYEKGNARMSVKGRGRRPLVGKPSVRSGIS